MNHAEWTDNVTATDSTFVFCGGREREQISYGFCFCVFGCPMVVLMSVLAFGTMIFYLGSFGAFKSTSTKGAFASTTSTISTQYLYLV